MTRTTKSSVYAKYGIFYKNDKIIHPILGKINELLINGNEKIGKGVWHFSTLPTNKEFAVSINGKEYKLNGTCPCTCSGCYATKGNYNYSTTIDALGVRTWLVYNDLFFVENCIKAQIEYNNIQFIRIHASGDFFNRDYASMWQDIVKEFPNTHFWTYTKNVEFETVLDEFDNANIVKSIIPHKGVNFGHCDYILALYEYLTGLGKSVYICKCGIDKNQHCANCKGCSNHEYVLFIEHSTEYKAEKDPLYPILKALIESQND